MWEGISQTKNSEVESDQHLSCNSWAFIAATHGAVDTVKEKGMDSTQCARLGWERTKCPSGGCLTSFSRYVGKVLTERKDGPGSRSALGGNSGLWYRSGHIDPYREWKESIEMDVNSDLEMDPSGRALMPWHPLLRVSIYCIAYRAQLVEKDSRVTHSNSYFTNSCLVATFLSQVRWRIAGFWALELKCRLLARGRTSGYRAAWIIEAINTKNVAVSWVSQCVVLGPVPPGTSPLVGATSVVWIPFVSL